MESPLDPASIHNPTVEVEAPGIVSVETLNPFDKTEVLVTGSAYFLEDPETGVARVLANSYEISDLYTTFAEHQATLFDGEYTYRLPQCY
jgi:hypothetical protein